MTDQKHLWAPWKMDYLKIKKHDSQKIFLILLMKKMTKEPYFASCKILLRNYELLPI